MDLRENGKLLYTEMKLANLNFTKKYVVYYPYEYNQYSEFYSRLEFSKEKK